MCHVWLRQCPARSIVCDNRLSFVLPLVSGARGYCSIRQKGMSRRLQEKAAASQTRRGPDQCDQRVIQPSPPGAEDVGQNRPSQTPGRADSVNKASMSTAYGMRTKNGPQSWCEPFSKCHSRQAFGRTSAFACCLTLQLDRNSAAPMRVDHLELGFGGIGHALPRS